MDLSHNQIVRLQPDLLSSLLNLKHLNLSHNPLRSVTSDTFRYLHKLESLHLHDVSLTQLDEGAFQHLRNLRDLRLYHLPDLPELNLSSILKYLPPLRSLAVDVKESVLDRQLLSIDPRHLKYVHLEGSDLLSVNIGAFLNLRGFEVQLVIKNTRIAELPPQIFETFRHISFLSLDLSHNRIQHLNPFRYSKVPAVSTQGTILTQVRLDNNPLHCTCDFQWVRDWFQHLKKSLPADQYRLRVQQWNETVCATPASLRGQKLVSINFDALGCNAVSLGLCQLIKLVCGILVIMRIFILI